MDNNLEFDPIDIGPPFLTHDQWVEMNQSTHIQWTLITLPIHIDMISPTNSDNSSIQQYIQAHRWIYENIKNPVYDDTFFDYYFSDPKDAMLFKLWLKI
jgi:hypothetical protein